MFESSLKKKKKTYFSSSIMATKDIDFCQIHEYKNK